jgi:Kdo2-lipid IVA lauroyltransferase/acyltransferase
MGFQPRVGQDFAQPIAVGVARRIGPGFRYEIRCEDVIDPNDLTGSVDDVRILTQRYTSALERLIRQDPTQYLWLHRRWKLQLKKVAVR